jgi:hypothetical protein
MLYQLCRLYNTEWQDTHELGKMWKKVVVAYCRLLLQLRETEKTRESQFGLQAKILK